MRPVDASRATPRHTPTPTPTAMVRGSCIYEDMNDLYYRLTYENGAWVVYILRHEVIHELYYELNYDLYYDYYHDLHYDLYYDRCVGGVYGIHRM